MSDFSNYVCPYCGREIDAKDVLFWETVKTQYTDNIRGEFLRRHPECDELRARRESHSLRPSVENPEHCNAELGAR